MEMEVKTTFHQIHRITAIMEIIVVVHRYQAIIVDGINVLVLILNPIIVTVVHLITMVSVKDGNYQVKLYIIWDMIESVTLFENASE